MHSSTFSSQFEPERGREIEIVRDSEHEGEMERKESDVN